MKLDRKAIIILIIFIVLQNIIMPITKATEINKANLKYMHEISTHIMFYNAGGWYEIKCGYIGYHIDGITYPAYCISHGLHGVDEEGDYTVTVNDLLKDKLIYNAIRNGYPYKTPAQLGVETVDDAYVATKQAVYSVILNRDVKSFYKAKDEKGEKIINAIYNISQNGKQENEENFESSCKIIKEGELLEEGTYYYQEYSVTAYGGISSYIIENISDFPEGVYISDCNNNKQMNFQGNEKFRVVIPKEILNKDISGTFKVKAISSANPIFYGEAPKENVQNYAVTYKVNADYTKEEKLNIKANNAKIEIIKKDEETLQPISDVGFALYDSENNIIESKETNKNGIVEFNSLYQGKYYIKEIEANPEYIEDDTIYEINTEFNKTINKVITNKHKKGNIKITKVDKDDNKITLGGIEFDLLDSNNQIIKHLTTDANGEVLVENINIGKYSLRETLTKREYNLCVDNDIDVIWNETTDIIIENEKMKGQIEIYKNDKDDNNIKLKGVKFEILNEQNKVIEKLVTNEKGYAISSRLLVGEYYLREIETNEKYILNKEPIKIVIENNKVQTLNVTNKKIKGKISIIKTSEADSPITNIRSGERVPNTIFDIYDSENNLVDTIITNEDGTAITKELEKGRYKVVERSTIKGFLLNSNEFFVNIDKPDEVKRLNISNIPAIPKLKIVKSGTEYAEKNEEIQYEFNIKNNGNVELNNFTWIEYLPYEQVKATKMMTGTYNQELDYKIYYKTNLKDFKLLKETNTYSNEYLDLSNIELEKGEVITQIKAEYGKVNVDFSTTLSPVIYSKIDNKVKKDEIIINTTEITGDYEGYIIKDKSNCKTIIKEKEVIKKLPKTGC